MEFNSKTGHEIRTWILFFVGIALAIIFAVKETPLNPWWTLIIGAFTSTAIIVSAVQAATGGVTDAGKKILENTKKELEDTKHEKSIDPPNTFSMGDSSYSFIHRLYVYNSNTI